MRIAAVRLMIKGVLFDLDNTLIDFMDAKLRGCEAALEAMIAAGLKAERAAAMRTLFALYRTHGIEHKYILQKFLRKTAGRIDLKLLAAGIVAYRKTQVDYHKPYDGVIPLLAELKKRNCKLGIVSDAPAFNAWLRITEMGITGYLDVVVAGSSKKKPHALPFRKAARALGLSEREILFVGDKPAYDINGAKKLGMKTALARYGLLDAMRKDAAKYRADYEIDDIKDILAIVDAA